MYLCVAILIYVFVRLVSDFSARKGVIESKKSNKMIF